MGWEGGLGDGLCEDFLRQGSTQPHKMIGEEVFLMPQSRHNKRIALHHGDAASFTTDHHLCQRAIQWVHRHVPGVACMPLQSDEAKKTLPTTLVTPPLTGVVLVDAEGEVHVGPKPSCAGAFCQKSVALGLRLVPSWGYALVARIRWVWGRDDVLDAR